MNRNKENGITLISIGIFLFILGVVLIFDRALMIAGNIITIVGMVFLLKSNINYFFESDKILGMLIFFLGIVSLVLRLTFFGFLLEIIGIIYLFKRSVPDFRTIIYRVMFFRILNSK